MADVDLGSLINAAAAVAVVVGVVIALAQIGQAQRKRRESAALELMRAFASRDFTSAYRTVMRLSDIDSAKALRARGEEVEDAAMMVGNTCEHIGVMVYHRVIPLVIVQHAMGGAIVYAWRALEPWVRDVRKEQGRERFFEWFEWLSDRLGETAPPELAAGVHVAYRDWRP